MAKVSASEFADNWGNGLQSNLSKMKRSIERMTENPMEKAVAAIPKMQVNFNKAVADGKVEAGFRSVSLSDWKNRFISIGIPRVQGGISDGKANVARFATALLAYQDSYLPELNSKPVMNAAEAKQKMIDNFDKMSAFKYRG